MLYWYSHWTQEEKRQLIPLLRPYIDKDFAITTKGYDFNQWCMLIVLADCGDELAFKKVVDTVASLTHDREMLGMSRGFLSPVSLLRDARIVDLLITLLDDDVFFHVGVDTRPRNLSLSLSAAFPLYVMVSNFPEFDWVHFHNKERLELKEWIEKNRPLKIRPLDSLLYYTKNPIDNAEIWIKYYHVYGSSF